MLKHPYIDDYIERYKNGEIIANKKLGQLIDFLEREILPRDDIYYFDDEQIADFIEFTESYYYQLDDWELFITPFVFLFFVEDDEVVFDQIILIMGRGAGKNGYISPLANYFLSSLHGIKKYNVSIIATSEDQAKTSFEDVYNMLTSEDNEDDEGLKNEFQAYKSSVTGTKTQSVFKYKTSNASTKDGGREGALFFDEFHAYEDDRTVRVFAGGLGKVEHRRQFFTGTKGYVRGGFFDKKYQRCEDILNGETPFNGIFPYIRELDDIKEIDDESAWPKANPALQPPLNKRGKRLLRTIRSEYTELNYEPSGRSEFVTKRMNLVEGDLEHSVASKDEINATNRPYFDLNGLTPVGSLDYGSVRDFAACGLLFKRGEEYVFDTYSFAIKHFVDVHYGYSNTASAMGGGKKAPIKDWEKRGLMEVVDEPSLDPRHIVDWFVDAREKYGVEKIVADNYKLDILRPLLEEEGFIVDQIGRPQSIHPLVAPRIEDGFASHKFIFGDNPLMRWYTNNVYVKETNNGKVFLKKEETKRKTDGFQSFVHALYRANELGNQQEFILDQIDW